MRRVYFHSVAGGVSLIENDSLILVTCFQISDIVASLYDRGKKHVFEYGLDLACSLYFIDLNQDLFGSPNRIEHGRTDQLQIHAWLLNMKSSTRMKSKNSVTLPAIEWILRSRTRNKAKDIWDRKIHMQRSCQIGNRNHHFDPGRSVKHWKSTI